MLTNKTEAKYFADIKKKFVDLQNFQKSNFDGENYFENLIIHILYLGSREIPKNLGPIGSAVLTFIGNKQTDKQTNKQTNRQTS